jgi:hypothetical protein
MIYHPIYLTPAVFIILSLYQICFLFLYQYKFGFYDSSCVIVCLYWSQVPADQTRVRTAEPQASPQRAV